MTLTFLRSRRTLTLLLLIGLVVGAQALLGRHQVRVGNTDPRFVPLALLLGPALLAGLLGLGAGNQLEPWDRLGCWRVTAARALHSAALLAVAAILAGAFSTQLDDGHGRAAIVRNVIGLTGLALLTVSVLGSTAAWIPPTLLSGAALVIGAAGPAHAAWTWLLQPDEARPAAAIAALLAAAGWTAYACRGDRGPASLSAVTG